MVSDKDLLKALDALEDRDARNLVWGLVDERWSDEDIREVISDTVPSYDPDDVLGELCNRHLVFEVEGSGWPQTYRTRMGESMRLLASLRQQFPRRSWQAAPRLVADFRFRHEPRRFPKRDITPDDAIADLAQHGLDGGELDAARRIIAERELSRFQVESTQRVFDAMAQRERGVVVSAGTGSGKTLAFYLPAFTHLATRPASDSVGVVALYPRNELLKDQLASAIDEARQLHKSGGRRLRIGAYFGPTPTLADPAMVYEWKGKPGEDRVCPFLTCRAETTRTRAGRSEIVHCGGVLVWRHSDLNSGRERLTCVSCGEKIGSDELVLTRASMQQRPPDLLFTTTEMLNRSLCDGYSMHLFGVGSKARSGPKLVLLDEVHTYEGTNGAQVAYLMRRWRGLMRGTPAWVGLSATLASAGQFFAELCGLGDGAVAEVRPHEADMEPRGREYQVVLRGDPAQPTALLSTTIQALMLLRRVLDPTDGGMGAYGSRVFAFCDNLDLVNRLFRQYMDAEGLTSWGAPKRGTAPLANLRLKDVPSNADVRDWHLRDRDGQQWWMPERIGFNGTLLRVGRTSSQDSGVLTNGDVIITTASLEVGFDDPRVGGVVQHKAPRDIAQFLQRRGRAGRTQLQRPWTVVVLSDYGRDRAAYQDYETLLDPALPEKKLPLGNQSVREMQAAMCLLDWSAQHLNVARQKRAKSMRQVFAGPPKPGDEEYKNLAKDTAELLAKVIAGGPEREDLKAFVARSLRLEPDELKSVCEEQPRSLLFDAIPTAHRRIASSWTRYEDGVCTWGAEPAVRDSPLPEFIPKALFSDLCLPEVAIEPRDDYDPAANVSIAVQLALNELAPGKVTLRWAVNTSKGLWIAPASDGQSVPLESGLAKAGDHLRTVCCDGEDIPLIRPLIMTPETSPRDIKTTSNGRLNWQLEFERDQPGIAMMRPRTGPFISVLDSVTAHLHTGHGGLRIWRYGSTVTSTISRASGRERVTNGFTWQGQRAAVGYEAMVDAIQVTLRVPEQMTEVRLEHDRRRLRQLRRDYFTYILCLRLEELRYDPFVCKQIADTVVAAAAATLATGPVDLATVPIATWRAHAEEALTNGTVDVGEYEETDSGEGNGLTTRQQELLQALDDPRVQAEITSAVPHLQAGPDSSWLGWLQARYVHTMAAAWQVAAQALCPEFDVEDDCVVDIVATAGQGQFLLSDSSIGGGGLVETLAHRLSQDPRRFDYLVLSALEPSDLEQIDISMRRCLALLESDKEVTDAALELRAVTGDRLAQWQQFLGLLASRGLSTAHASMSALSSRVFRTGSGPASDSLLRLCMAKWDAIEERSGFAIDHRGICAALAADREVRDLLAHAVPTVRDPDHARTNSVLLGLLWPSAEARRAASLVAVNRFVGDTPATERTLVLDTLPDPANPIDVDDGGWLAALADQIAAAGRCQLISVSNDTSKLKRALQTLATSPVELAWLHVYPRIEAVTANDGLVGIEVSLEEVPQ